MYKRLSKKQIVIIALVSVLVVVGIYKVGSNGAIEVTTAEVVEGAIEEYVEELGVVKASNSASIYTFAGGRVTEVLVEVGDNVKKGDILVKLDNQQLERQIIELEAQKTSVEAQYREAKKPYDADEIKKLQIIIADMERRLKETEENVAKSEVLQKAGAISKQEYQNILLNFESDKTSLEKSKIDLEQMKKPLSENIKLQYEAQLKQIDTQLEELRSRGADYSIASPVDGIVLMETIDVGAYMQPGAHIMEVGDVGKLYVESDVLVGDIAKVKVGNKVKISNKSLDLREIEGVVSKIYPQAFSKVSDLGIEQKRIKVEIELKEGVSNIKPGYDLDLFIIVNSKEKALIIPEAAVFQLEGKDHVFVNEGGNAALREIQKGIESQKLIEVLEGLNKGEVVVVSPEEELKDGARVKAR